MTGLPKKYASDYVDGSGYEGASTGNRLNDWALSAPGVNSISQFGLQFLQARSRDLERNCADIWGAADSYKSKIVGSGITPRWQHKSVKIKKAIQELWESQLQCLDFDGRLNFYGLQALVAGSEYISGEVFVKHIFSSNKSLPYQIQILESDYVPIEHTEDTPNGNPIYMGIEISKSTGKRSAYWVYKNNPKDELLGDIDLIPFRIPADQMLHIYDVRRPGQLRGIPNTSSAMITTKDYDQFQDAELQKIKISNLFAGFIEPEYIASNVDASVMPNQEVLDQVTDGEPDYSMNPGTMLKTNPGEKVKFSNPPDVSGLDEWRKSVNRRRAKGLNTTYEDLTGDLSGVNFSSIRAGLIEHRRYMIMRCNNVLIFPFCRPVGFMWLRQNVIAGNLPVTAITASAKWTPQMFEHVKPLEDARTLIMLERAGHFSHEEVQEMLGKNYELTMAQIKAHNELLDKDGLVFDTDPRNITDAGIKQAEVETDESLGDKQ